MTRDRINKLLGSIPTHVIVILTVIVWIVPTLGLMITSFRPLQDIDTTGWWTVLSPRPGPAAYTQFCAECHGSDGKKLPGADLTDPAVIDPVSRSLPLLANLRKPINGEPHLGTKALPSAQEAADIATYLRQISSGESRPRFTLGNYVEALVGYRGTNTYAADCKAGTQSSELHCNLSDLLNSRGMARAFMNSVIVTFPATLLPILFAAFAGYAFAWLDFKGRFVLFSVLVGLQIVPLQMTLVPISRLYAQLHLNGTFLGVWLFHTGFGLPYAIYLMRNFLGSLPRDLFESAYLDGANHWTVFRRLVIPLTTPAIASLGIFQFLWVWNDLLVALVFLGGQTPVMTYQISNMVTSVGAGWQLLTASAFLSMILPMIVFFALQRYFVRGMLSGAVKG
jgi:alpha-glucoside transport system permease protein